MQERRVWLYVAGRLVHVQFFFPFTFSRREGGDIMGQGALADLHENGRVGGGGAREGERNMLAVQDRTGRVLELGKGKVGGEGGWFLMPKSYDVCSGGGRLGG